MSKANRQLSATLEPLLDLRLTDLIVRTAHVRRKDVLRVIKALALVAEEYQLDPSDILRMPIDSSGPNLQQKRRCETAYLWLYENDGYQRALFEIEQLV